MIQLNSQWGETAETLFQESISSENKRLRERYLALALIASGKSIQSVASQIHRRRQTVSEWVHKFNQKGREGLIPKFKSTQKPALNKEEFKILDQVVQRPPRRSGIKTGRWSGKSAAAYIKKVFGKTVHPHTARRYLRRLGFVLKKPRKKFTKAREKDQRAFAMALERLEQSRPEKSVTVWIDEGHIWQDALLRRMWCPKAKEACVDSLSPGKKKLSFYVAVVRPLGKIITLQVKKFHQQNTARFLKKIRTCLPGYHIDAVWDNAPYHQGNIIQEIQKETNIHVHHLPSYSPHMNAAEQWIRWAKETLSYNICWETLKTLIRSFNGFVASMAQRTSEILSRCVSYMFGFNCC